LVGIKEYIKVITTITIIIAITVIGTSATTEVVPLVTQAAGVIVDQVGLLLIRVMVQIITVIETTAEVVLLVGIQKVLFFVMAIPLFVIQALLLALSLVNQVVLVVL
jgi:hypothetical protein